MKRLSTLGLPLFIALATLCCRGLNRVAGAPPHGRRAGAAIDPAVPGVTTITLVADADATIKSGSPDGNFGGASGPWTCSTPAGAHRCPASCCTSTSPPACRRAPTIGSAQLQVRLNSGTGVDAVTV